MMENKLQNRRDFLRNVMKVGVGVTAMSMLSPVAGVLAEEEKQKDYEWIPSAPPCKLIEEITASDAPEGTRTFKFTTDGRTCSKNVVFDIVGEDQILKNVVYEGGCNGGTQGIGVMAEGRPAAEVADILEHIVCDLKKSGSSCGQQLAFGIKQAMMIINGTPCSGCSGTVCENMK
ncbi:MAG TPA: TSCPD domain-containing protein [Candidatus Ventricola gallistercoris]|nr:TSCPD domain-containing protein [Candidatus Ventricola gallistercoris]